MIETNEVQSEQWSIQNSDPLSGELDQKKTRADFHLTLTDKVGSRSPNQLGYQPTQQRWADSGSCQSQ